MKEKVQEGRYYITDESKVIYFEQSYDLKLRPLFKKDKSFIYTEQLEENDFKITKDNTYTLISRKRNIWQYERKTDENTLVLYKTEKELYELGINKHIAFLYDYIYNYEHLTKMYRIPYDMPFYQLPIIASYGRGN